MFRFATPGYLYLLLLLPLLAGLYVYAVRSRRRALERFADEAVLPGLMPEASPVRLRLKFVLLCLGLGFIILALARPQFGSKLREVTRQGVEIMLAVDVSNSMLAQDFEPSRLADQVRDRPPGRKIARGPYRVDRFRRGRLRPASDHFGLRYCAQFRAQYFTRHGFAAGNGPRCRDRTRVRLVFFGQRGEPRYYPDLGR